MGGVLPISGAFFCKLSNCALTCNNLFGTEVQCDKVTEMQIRFH